MAYNSDGEPMAHVPKLACDANSAGTLDGQIKKYIHKKADFKNGWL